MNEPYDRFTMKMPHNVRDARRRLRKYEAGDRVFVFGTIAPDEFQFVGAAGVVEGRWDEEGHELWVRLDDGPRIRFLSYELEPAGPQDFKEIDEGGVV